MPATHVLPPLSVDSSTPYPRAYSEEYSAGEGARSPNRKLCCDEWAEGGTRALRRTSSDFRRMSVTGCPADARRTSVGTTSSRQPEADPAEPRGAVLGAGP